MATDAGGARSREASLTPLLDVSPAAIRERQQRDVRQALKRRSPQTVAEISEAIWMPVFSVTCRLKERPDWFQETEPGVWTFRRSGAANARR